MAEPAGFFIETTLDEGSVKKLLNHSFSQGEPMKKVGYYLSELLYECNDEDNVFIFHYEKSTQTCFIGWLLNHFQDRDTTLFCELFPILAALQQANTKGYAITASSCDVFAIHEISAQKVSELKLSSAHKALADSVINKFWSFQEKDGSWATPTKALSKRNYLYKNFKNYYKRYIQYREELLKPRRIAEATLLKPFHLCKDFYTFDGKVYDLGIMYEFDKTIETLIEIVGADPYTLREEAGIIADKNSVFRKHLADNSPPPYIEKAGGFSLVNPDAIWEYKIEEGIDGGSFKYLGDKYEVIYYRDKYSVYAFSMGTGVPSVAWRLKRVEEADSSSFVYLDFCYGKDKNHTFYNDKIIPINPHRHTINKHGFIYDEQHIFHYGKKISLDASTFKVIEYESDTNPFMGTFILGDKNGKYEYKSDFNKECSEAELKQVPTNKI